MLATAAAVAAGGTAESTLKRGEENEVDFRFLAIRDAIAFVYESSR